MVNVEARLKRGQNKVTALGRKCSNLIFRVTIFIVCVLVRAHVHTEASMSDLLFLSLPYSMKHVLLTRLEVSKSPVIVPSLSHTVQGLQALLRP